MGLGLDFLPLFANVSIPASLQCSNWINMVNFISLTSFAYVAQGARLGANAHNNSSQLLDIVPKREVLYVGGSYTNITASFESTYFAHI
jgi:hypothetical protein